MHILITEPVHPVALDWFAEKGVHIVAHFDGEPWEPVERIRAIVTRSFKVTPEVLDRLPALEVVAKYGVGVNTIDLDACAARGIKVTNLPGANANSVAEHGVALLTAAIRDLIVCDTVAREGRFEDRFGIRFMAELTDANVGIYGGGRIGRRIAEICHAGYQCQIGLYDPFVPDGTWDDLSVNRFDTIADMFDWADYVVVAAPLTDQTRKSVGADELRRLGADGIIVVSSRGGIVDEHALAEAVASGTIRGAGLDVFDGEPPSPDNPLFGLKQVVVTPHVGGASEKSRRRMGLQLCEQVWALLNGQDAILVGNEAWL
jgi:D-3-phosphoglycerate dehydrogenase / 2-oxoglutarate reductase